MILSKEQINRYLRHIIMPEISGAGQKKMLDTTVLLYGETVEEISTLIYYLSASGVGHLICYLEDYNGFGSLTEDIKDLNNDIKVEPYNEAAEDNHISSRIVLGRYNFVNGIISSVNFKQNFVPTVMAVINQWKGILKTFDNEEDLKNFIGLFSDENHNYLYKTCGNMIVSCVLGTICSTEAIKLCLKIGDIRKEILYFDLLTLDFNYINYDKKLIAEKFCVNNENINYDEINKKLSQSKVLIIGTGGLGSPAALALTLAGVGTLGLIDNDVVEISNLNRQILHSISCIGMPKVESANIFLKKLNPYINIHTYKELFNVDNAQKIINDYDIVFSAVDNIQTRYILNDACYFARKPLVEAGVLGFYGTNTTIIPDKGHCYRCLFPNVSANGLSCSETGVLGPIPGTMGFIQAAEAIKVISEVGETLNNKMLIYDGLNLEIDLIDINKNPECPLCGEDPSIKTLKEYDYNCTKEELM